MPKLLFPFLFAPIGREREFKARRGVEYIILRDVWLARMVLLCRYSV